MAGIIVQADRYGQVDDSVGIISVWAAILAIELGFSVAAIVPYTYPFAFRFFR